MAETQTIRVGTYTYGQVAKAIDHSLLKPELTEAEVVAGCELAKERDVASVSVRPCDVPLAARLMAGSDVAVGTVIGFPHGAHTTAVKVFEANEAMANGAVELDLVLNIGQLRSGNLSMVGAEIAAVVAAAKVGKALVKVILENAYLTDEQKIAACALAVEAGADFVKTSTGYAPTGATIEDLRLMRAHVPAHVQVKAAGGVRTLDALLAVLDTGATRVGATATAVILDDFRARAVSDSSAARPQDGGALSDGY